MGGRSVWTPRNGELLGGDGCGCRLLALATVVLHDLDEGDHEDGSEHDGGDASEQNLGCAHATVLILPGVHQEPPIAVHDDQERSGWDPAVGPNRNEEGEDGPDDGIAELHKDCSRKEEITAAKLAAKFREVILPPSISLPITYESQ